MSHYFYFPGKIRVVEWKSTKEAMDIPTAELDRVAKYGLDEVRRVAAIESHLSEHKAYLSPGSPAYNHYSLMKPTDTAAAVGELGLMVTITTQKLKTTQVLIYSFCFEFII